MKQNCKSYGNIESMEYIRLSSIQPRFGHEDAITSIDCLLRGRALTSGGRDHSIRVWKVDEESQLVFKGHR